jgi:hypothetical protein
MCIGDHQPDTGQPSGDEPSQERGPARSILGGVQVKPQDLPSAGGVHAGGDHAGHVADPPVLAHLLRERIEPEVGVGTAVEWAGPEGFDLVIEFLGHLRHAGLGDPLDPERPHESLDPPRRDASDVRLADDLDERALGTPARLEQPVGEVGTLADLRDGQIDRAGSGVPGPGAVPVAAVRPLFRALAVGGAADRVHLLGHHPLAEELHQLSQQVRVRLLDLLANPRKTVHRGVDHRAPPPRVPCRSR